MSDNKYTVKEILDMQPEEVMKDFWERLQNDRNAKHWLIRVLNKSRYSVLQLDSSKDERYEKVNDEVRNIQICIRNGMTHKEAQAAIGIDDKWMELITKYLRYRERHIYDEEEMDTFGMWVKYRQHDCESDEIFRRACGMPERKED